MDEEKVYYTIILRHDTSTNWMMNNPILALSEYGVEDDTHRVKRGDGQSNWADLPYEHFGLEYLVTFENLLGEVEDNEALKEAFNGKVDKNIFTENANGIIENITLTEEEGFICKIMRLTKDVVTGSARNSYLRIKSKDNSIQGLYSIDDEGIRILNLQSYSHINDYEPGKIYYINELCYVDNKLYRALDDGFTAEENFTKAHWVLLASLHSNDIKYNHLRSGLEADNVKDALDELQDLDSQKVKKTNRENKVYGTDQFGEQFLYNKDDLRTVDTVNHIQADASKNIQIDSDQINYSDANPENGTIRQVLDSKVDKTVAGRGAKIVRDVQFEYNDQTGHIVLREDKFSLEDGSSATEEREIDVVSEQELENNVETLNTRITNEVSTLNERIDNEVDTLNDRVTNEVSTLNTRITNEVQTLNETIDRKETALYNKIQEEHDEINDRVDEEVVTLNDRISSEVTTLNNTINTKEAALQAQIDTNASEIERVETERTAEDERIEQESKDRDTALGGRIDDAITDYTNKINNAVDDLNNRIDEEVSTLNDTIDEEVEILNTTIETKESDLYDKIAEEKAALNLRIDNEVATLNTTINTKDAAMDAKKIDKDISTLIVTDVVAASQSQEPTIKIIQKNTTTKESVIHHLHFRAQGNIITSFLDGDHIVIDSTAIDTIDTQQNTRLTNAESRLDAHDTSIGSLFEHDVNHDREIAANAAQIANHETRLLAAENDIDNLETGLDNEITNRTTADTNLSTRIADNAVRIANNTQAIRDNAESIDNLAQALEENIEALTNAKADKDFAEDSNNKVVGKLESDAITGSELFNLKETMVSPVDGSSSIERIKIISSDGTVVATRGNDGTIDLATNLDTDVNYFVTTEIISTTIAAETTLDMTKLTPTDKTDVELQDIISDPEGTWGRVKSINTQNDTCVVITFKKHAQAVWGTIKGTLADQTDLKTALDNLAEDISDEATARSNADTTLQNNIDAEELARQQADSDLQDAIDGVAQDLTDEVTARGVAEGILQDNIDGVASDLTDEVTARQNADSDLQDAIDAEELARQNADNTKVDKVSSVNKVYGTDNNGNQTTFNKSDFGIVDTVNNVSVDTNTKNVTIDAGDILLDKESEYSETLRSIVSDLLIDVIHHIQRYVTDKEYEPTGTYTDDRFVTFERDDGIILMAKVVRTFTATTQEATDYEAFIADVEAGNLKLIGIPEQDGLDPQEQEAEEVMEILNQVEGVQDTYEGLGGTEAEVEGILDEILGNE